MVLSDLLRSTDSTARSIGRQGIVTGRQRSTIDRLLHDLLIAQHYQPIAQIRRWHATHIFTTYVNNVTKMLLGVKHPGNKASREQKFPT